MVDLAATSKLDDALALVERNRERSVRALSDLVRIPSLTGEEGAAQESVAATLRTIGAAVEVLEPDVERMFAAFPDVAQYPTHWQHDLILPYETLPTYGALKDSGLENVLNYRGRPNVVGRLSDGRVLIAEQPLEFGQGVSRRTFDGQQFKQRCLFRRRVEVELAGPRGLEQLPRRLPPQVRAGLWPQRPQGQNGLRRVARGQIRGQ